VIDWTAIATFGLGCATLWLGWQASRQVGEARALVAEAREAELHRRADLHIVEADPIRARATSYNINREAETATVQIQIDSIGSRPVFKITATMGWDRSAYTEPQRKDFLPPGDHDTFEYRLEPFISFLGDQTKALAEPELTVESYGLLGQRVVQSYTLNLDVVVEGRNMVAMEQTRIEIVPNVPGAASSVTIG